MHIYVCMCMQLEIAMHICVCNLKSLHGNINEQESLLYQSTNIHIYTSIHEQVLYTHSFINIQTHMHCPISIYTCAAVRAYK